jgi:hypothetical protein
LKKSILKRQEKNCQVFSWLGEVGGWMDSKGVLRTYFTYQN